MLSRAACVPQRLPPCRSPLSQHLGLRLVSTEPADATKKWKGAPLRTAYIRSWRPAESITQSWIMIREIEKRYGRVLETHFLKDFEEPGKYQMMTYIVFEDPRSLDGIPDSGIDLTVSARPTNKPTHEISLEDVEHLSPSSRSRASLVLDEHQQVPAADPRNDSSVLGFRIHRAKMNYVPENFRRDYIFQQTPRRTMQHFEAWGGFANLAPLDPPRVMKEHELFAGPGVNEQKRMRAALDICARNLKKGKPNSAPAVTLSSSSSIKSSSAVDEKPQDIQQAPSTPSPEPSLVADSPAPTPTPTSVLQETTGLSPTPKAKSESPTATKSESPKLTPQPIQKVTSKPVESLSNETLVTKPAATVTPSTPVKPSPSQSSSQPSKKVAASKPSKPTGHKLPPPVQQRPTANIPRRLPKPRIQVSKSAPIRPAPTQSETTMESQNEEAAPAEAPGTLSRLWGLLTGKRG